ncbi:hypothetical protein BH11MYX4_BH11MYX4_62170 [soil metagenome]
MTSRFLAVSGLVLLALVTGCAYRTPAAHLPAALPAVAPGALDVSDVTVVDANGPIDDATVAGVREEAAAILVKAAKERVGPAAGGGAVVHAHVTLEERRNFVESALRQDGIAAFGLWPVPLGMVIGQQRLTVDVEVERNGRTFRGHGSAEKMGSIYAPARRRALAVALDRALADATPCAETPCVVPLRP